MKKILTIIILILTMTVSVAYAATITGYTNISSIALYKSNDYSSKTTDILKINSKVEIIEEQDDWCNVKTEDGTTGWIEKYFITVPAEKYVVNNTEYNIKNRYCKLQKH
ncbi:MAG: SH3 domain-containing protein [Sedimentibacter sp.]